MFQFFPCHTKRLRLHNEKLVILCGACTFGVIGPNYCRMAGLLSRVLSALLLYPSNIFGYWPANIEAKGEECMTVTGWWNDPHGKTKHGRISSTILRHSLASMFIGLGSLRHFPLGVSEVWRVCYSSLVHAGSKLPHSEGNWNKYWCFIAPNCAGLCSATGLYRMSRR